MKKTFVEIIPVDDQYRIKKITSVNYNYLPVFYPQYRIRILFWRFWLYWYSWYPRDKEGWMNIETAYDLIAREKATKEAYQFYKENLKSNF